MASGDEDALICALLHDVVEDGGVDLDGIRQEFGDAAGDAVGLLTHEEGVPYLDYVRHIAESGSAAAIRCKISTLRRTSISRVFPRQARRILSGWRRNTCRHSASCSTGSRKVWQT